MSPTPLIGLSPEMFPVSPSTLVFTLILVPVQILRDTVLFVHKLVFEFLMVYSFVVRKVSLLLE